MHVKGFVQVAFVASSIVKFSLVRVLYVPKYSCKSVCCVEEDSQVIVVFREGADDEEKDESGKEEKSEQDMTEGHYVCATPVVRNEMPVALRWSRKWEVVHEIDTLNIFE